MQQFMQFATGMTMHMRRTHIEILTGLVGLAANPVLQNCAPSECVIQLHAAGLFPVSAHARQTFAFRNTKAAPRIKNPEKPKSESA